MENIVLYIVAFTTTEMEFDLWHVIPDAVRHETNKSFIPRSNGQLGGKSQGVTNRDLKSLIYPSCVAPTGTKGS